MAQWQSHEPAGEPVPADPEELPLRHVRVSREVGQADRLGALLPPALPAEAAEVLGRQDLGEARIACKKRGINHVMCRIPCKI